MSSHTLSPEQALSTLLLYFHDYHETLPTEEVRKFCAFLRKDFLKSSKPVFSLFEQKKQVEFFRKILARLGSCPDVISLTQEETSDRILSLRKKADRGTFTSSQKGCRFLLRVDDFPSFFASSESFYCFHEIAREHQIPYLLAITPYLHTGGLTDAEIKMLHQCRLEGMTPALHGFTHQRIRPHVSSELLGFPEQELRDALKKACSYLKSLSLEPSVFVAPFNSYDANTVSVLSEEFAVLCGGPESVHSLGYQGSGFIGDSLYIPSYRGAYDLKADLRWIEKMKAAGHGLIIPLTLHWANELKNNFSNFKRLCNVIRGQMLSWDDLLVLRARINAAVLSDV